MIPILPFLSTTAPPQAPPIPGGGEAFALLMADMGGRQPVAADGTALPEPEPEAIVQPPVEPRVAAKFREPAKRSALPTEREPVEDDEVEAETSEKQFPAPSASVTTVRVEIAPPGVLVAPTLADRAPIETKSPDHPVATPLVPVAAALIPTIVPPADEPTAALASGATEMTPVQAWAVISELRPALVPPERQSWAEPAREVILPSPAQAGAQPVTPPSSTVTRPELAVAGPRPSPEKLEVIASREPSSAPIKDVPPAPVARDGRPAPEPVAPKPPRVEAVLPTAAPRALASGPAAQVFAAEIRRAARETRAPAPIATTAAPAPTEPGLRPADPPTAPVDTTDARWPQDMLARIERLRDDADAADTSIRLLPDALGEVEVALRREGDAVHVRFTAEEAGTRALLQEAAPRLAEAAEARGLKLGQLGVASGGSGGADPQGRPQHQPAPTPSTPARAPRPTTERDEPADTRIA